MKIITLTLKELLAEKARAKKEGNVGWPTLPMIMIPPKKDKQKKDRQKSL